VNLDFLDHPVSQRDFGLIVGLTQQTVSEAVRRKILPTNGTLGDWLKAYCQRLREQATGRAGDKQVDLTICRAEESEMKTNLLRPEYEEKLGKLIIAADAEYLLRDWAGLANREFGIGVEDIVAAIESEHGIVIDREKVTKIAGATIERVRAHAEAIGRRLAPGVGVDSPGAGPDA